MDSVAARARQIVEALERGDVDTVSANLGPRLQAFSIEGYLGDTWRPVLDEVVGADREVVDATSVAGNPLLAKVTIRGDAGSTVIAVGFDAEQRLVDLVIAAPPDGILNVVIGTPFGVWRNDRVEGEPRELAGFYADLLGMKIIRDDWIKIARDRRTRPEIAFGDGWSDERPPRWPDPEYPQQLHLDVLAPDLHATEQRVLANGARPLQDQGAFRSYADPFGHPFCLYLDASVSEPVLARIVFDCPDPDALATFYEGLLGMSTRVEETADRVVIGYDDGRLPMLAFQRSVSLAPRWPDPAYPAQVHLDLYFDDGRAAKARAEALGAVPLPPQGGSAPVYADPAGHPFCLCSPGES